MDLDPTYVHGHKLNFSFITETRISCVFNSNHKEIDIDSDAPYTYLSLLFIIIQKTDSY